MQCIRCESEQTRRDGQTRLGGQRWRCNVCGRRFTLGVPAHKRELKVWACNLTMAEDGSDRHVLWYGME